jgi:hypothetical protein
MDWDPLLGDCLGPSSGLQPFLTIDAYSPIFPPRPQPPQYHHLIRLGGVSLPPNSQSPPRYPSSRHLILRLGLSQRIRAGHPLHRGHHAGSGPRRAVKCRVCRRDGSSTRHAPSRQRHSRDPHLSPPQAPHQRHSPSPSRNNRHHRRQSPAAATSSSPVRHGRFSSLASRLHAGRLALRTGSRNWASASAREALGFIEYWDDGAVEAISVLRRVGTVVLEPWLEERYPGGELYAVEKTKEKGLKLEFCGPDSLHAD